MKVQKYKPNQIIVKQNNNQLLVEQGNKMLALVELDPEDQASAGILKDAGSTLYYAARTGAQGLVTMVFFDTAAMQSCNTLLLLVYLVAL